MGSNLGGGPTRMACKLLHVAVFVAREFSGVERPIPHAAFFVRALGAKLQRPQRPGRARGAVLRRHGHDFELVHGLRLLPVARAQAVRAGVAAADDHDALARGQDLIRHCVPGDALVLLREKLHGEVNSLEFAPGNFEVARIFSAAGQQNGVKFLAKVLRGNVPAHVGSRLEFERPPPSSVRGAGPERAFPA